MGAYLNQSKDSRIMTGVFHGLDKRERITDGAWSDMLNMTGESYPCASSRHKRATQLFTEKVTEDGTEQKRIVGSDYKILAAECSDGELNILEYKVGKAFNNIAPYYIRLRSTKGLTQQIKAGYLNTISYAFNKGRLFTEYGIIRNGRDICVYPVMSHTNYVENGGVHILHEVKADTEIKAEEYDITIVPVDEDGTQITVQASDSAPANPTNGTYWYDTVNKGLYRYSDSSARWVAWAACYTKITAVKKDTGKPFSPFFMFGEGDAVTIQIEKAFGEKTVDSSFIVHQSLDEASALVIKGYLEQNEDISRITVTRKAPFLQHACSWRNRIWGCCYGEYDGVFLNEIYGSALGDISNFFKYEGTAADSYTVSVGTGGKFTGIAQLEDCVVFFKEDRYYVLTGGEPPFSLNEYSGAGIQNGSAKSAVVINGYVYYKSYGGIMRMSPDSRPVKVSETLGTDIWENAVAGTDGERYFVSMSRIDNGEQEFFVYDTLTGLWTQEDNTFVSPPAAILRYRNSAFAVGSAPRSAIPQAGSATASGEFTPVIQYFDAENANKLTLTNLGGWDSETATAEKTVAWHADTGVMGFDDPDNKFVKRIQVRGRLGADARIGIEISYDGHTEDRERLYTEENEIFGTFNAVYTPPVRCDNFRLHFSGVGECVIYSVTVTTEEANDYAQR